MSVFVVTLGLLAGFNPFKTKPEPLMANKVTKQVELSKPTFVPKEANKLALTIDLKTDKVSIEHDSKDTETIVTINKEEKAVQPKPKVLIKEVDRVVFVHDIAKSTRLMNQFLPIGKPTFISPISAEEKRTPLIDQTKR